MLILTNEPHNYSNGRFRAEGALRGHVVECVAPGAFAPGTLPAAATPGAADPAAFDAVLARRGSAFSPAELAVLRAFEVAGVAVLNDSAAIALAQDKMASLQVLTRHGVPVPSSALVRGADDVDRSWDALGPAPHVLKPIVGTHGQGVALVATPSEAKRAILAPGARERAFVLQEFIREAAGTDLRLLVVGDAVVAGMRRRAASGDFRANFHAGGRAEPFEPDAPLAKLALAATNAIGLDVAGVDLIQSARGPLVIEVNSGPGFQALEAATGRDVAAAVLDLAERRARARGAA